MTDGATEEVVYSMNLTFKSERDNFEITARILNIVEEIEKRNTIHSSELRK